MQQIVIVLSFDMTLRAMSPYYWLYKENDLQLEVSLLGRDGESGMRHPSL